MASYNRKKPSVFIWAFLALCVLFLALGYGTLGSTLSVGDPYELYTEKVKSNNEKESFSVVFLLENPKEVDENGKQSTVYMNIYDIYMNVASVHSEAGVNGKFTMTRSSSATSFSENSNYKYSVEIENLKTETLEEGKTSAAIPNALGNWIRPFKKQLVDTKHDAYSVGTYKYYKLVASSSNLLVNEVVFVGQVLDGQGGNVVEGEPLRVIPAKIHEVTPLGNESKEEARVRAHALIDTHTCYYKDKDGKEQVKYVGMKKLPSDIQSSYYRLSAEEANVMATIAEMREGGNFVAENVYYGDRVSGSLGICLMALSTRMFGMSPFGLRFFPMLASFGILVLGFFFARMLVKHDGAAFAFALVYALCNFSFGLGHLGTPVLIGAFFFLASLMGAFAFFLKGIKKGIDALPLVLSGLCGAAAITVNGAFLIPVAGVTALFAMGLLRQLKARRYYLDLAIEEAEAEEKGTLQISEDRKGPVGKARVVAVLGEYRRKNRMAVGSFFASMVVSAFLFAILLIIPLYNLFVKLYGNSLSHNIFAFAAQAFANGYVGSNPYAGGNPWALFYTLMRGTGDVYAITSIVPNVMAMLFGFVGIVYAAYRISMLVKAREWGKSEFTVLVTLLDGIAVSLVMASFSGGALGFFAVAYACAFLLGASAVKFAFTFTGKAKLVVDIVTITGIVLLVAFFALSFVFTFSLPLPVAFMQKF